MSSKYILWNVTTGEEIKVSSSGDEMLIELVRSFANEANDDLELQIIKIIDDVSPYNADRLMQVMYFVRGTYEWVSVPFDHYLSARKAIKERDKKKLDNFTL